MSLTPFSTNPLPGTRKIDGDEPCINVPDPFSPAEGLEARFEQIAELPRLYPAADHIKPGYRLSVYTSHTIYYRADEHEVLIVRILRNQDPSIALVEDPEG